MLSIARRGIGSRVPIGRRQIAGKGGQADVGYTRTFQPGSATFRALRAGYHKFAVHGPGGIYNGAGPGSGAYAEKTVYLSPADAVPIVVGRSGTDTTVTLPNGPPLVAGSGGNGSVGVASGGDVNLNGSLSNTNGLGAGGGLAGGGAFSGGGAPGSAEFPGGRGGKFAGGAFAAGLADGQTPGAGGGATDGGVGLQGGDGRVVVFFVRD